jgi:DNA helicase IV
VSAVHERLPGRIAVIAAEERLADLHGALTASGDLPRVGAGSAGVDDEIAVMSAQDAKGLEFDIVVLVEPAELVDAHGAGDLYVAMSRSTQHLGVLHARPLPCGMAG